MLLRQSSQHTTLTAAPALPQGCTLCSPGPAGTTAAVTSPHALRSHAQCSPRPRTARPLSHHDPPCAAAAAHPRHAVRPQVTAPLHALLGAPHAALPYLSAVPLQCRERRQRRDKKRNYALPSAVRCATPSPRAGSSGCSTVGCPELQLMAAVTRGEAAPQRQLLSAPSKLPVFMVQQEGDAAVPSS